MSIRKRCASDTARTPSDFFSSRGETKASREEKRDKTRTDFRMPVRKSVPHTWLARRGTGEPFPTVLNLTAHEETRREERRGRGFGYNGLSYSYTEVRFDAVASPRPRHPAGCPQLVGVPRARCASPSKPHVVVRSVGTLGAFPRTHDLPNRRCGSRWASIELSRFSVGSPPARHHHLGSSAARVVHHPLRPVREVRERASVDRVRLGRARVAPRLRDEARMRARALAATARARLRVRRPRRGGSPSGTAVPNRGSSSSTRAASIGAWVSTPRCSTHTPASNQGARAVATARTRRRRTTR